MEALMGAIYISIGYKKSFNFFVTLLSKHLNELMSSVPILDPKSRLQIVTQEKYELLPVYYTFQIDEGFASEVFINDTKLGDGTGKSKRDAEKEAAKKALRNIEDNDFKI
jgi:ribonuclease-3